MKRFLIPLSCCLLSLAACDWRVFNDFERQATVQVIEPPRNFAGTNFGQAVAPVLDENGGIVPNTFLAGGNGTTPLAVVTVSETGAISRKTCRIDAGISVSSITPLPAKNGRWRALLSDGNYQMANLVNFDPDEDEPKLQVEGNLSGLAQLFGIGTLHGDFDGDRTPDVAVASRNRLYFFDEALQTAHQHIFDYPHNFFVPAMQDAGTRILAPVVREGKILLAIGGMISNDTGNTTWAVLLVSVNPGFTFETQVLQGDFSNPDARVCSLATGAANDDANDDLVVGICNETLLFLAKTGTTEWFSAQPDRVVAEDGKMRGRIVALSDLNQDGKPELAIADPEEPIESNRNGEVLFYDLQISADTPLLQLKAPKEEKRFGTSLFSLKTIWKDGRTELVVGGANVSYLFFLTGLPGDDDPVLHDPR